MPPTPPTECPVCGADVPRGAKACPECGADERSGWNEEDTRYDGLDLPDSAFEDDADRAQNRPSSAFGPSVFQTFPAWLWWLVGIALIALLVSQALF